MATQKRFPFSKGRLEALPVPATGRVYWHDAKVSGLALCVTASGSKSFYLYRRLLAGPPVRVLIGKCPEVSVENARKKAEALNVEISAGGNPQERKRQAREVLTLGDLFGYFMETHSRPHNREVTVKDKEAQFIRYLDGWKGRKITTIRKSDVLALHTRIGKEHPYAANRLRSLLHTLFTVAIDNGLHPGPNPVQGVKKFREESRDRFLSEEELPKFFQALAEESNPILQAFFMLALMTGARRSNVQRMRWEEIDWDRKVWRVPMTKAGVPIVVPLSPPALETLRRLQEFTGSGEWVLPAIRAPRNGNPGYLMDPTPAWRRLLKRAGLSGLRIHDLRRSAGSWMALTGASLLTVGKALGHARQETTAIYARLTVDATREALNRGTAAMLEAGGVKMEPPAEPAAPPNQAAGAVAELLQRAATDPAMAEAIKRAAAALAENGGNHA